MNLDVALFHALAERLEDRARELGKLVEVQDAMVGAGDGSRPRYRSTADERDRTRGVMRTAHGRDERQVPTEIACCRGNRRNLNRLWYRQLRQNARHTGSKH